MANKLGIKKGGPQNNILSITFTALSCSSLKLFKTESIISKVKDYLTQFILPSLNYRTLENIKTFKAFKEWEKYFEKQSSGRISAYLKKSNSRTQLLPYY